MKKNVSILIAFLLINYAFAQDKNFYTTIGLGIVTSVPVGNFKSKNSTNPKSGYAFNEYDGFKFTLEQNLGRRFGFSLDFYSMYYKVDLNNLEKSIQLNNRGLSGNTGLRYEIRDTLTEWSVGIGNFGFYYYRYLGEKKKFLLNFIFDLTVTQMESPAFVVNIRDSSNNLLEVRPIETSLSWREVFLLPPIDGFGLECNARYFFARHFSANASFYFASCKGYFDGKDKALINMSTVPYTSFNFSLGVNYTIFYKKKEPKPAVTEGV